MLIKVTRRAHPGLSGLWIWWQCSSFLSASSCLCSSPALLFFHPNNFLSLAHQRYINFFGTSLCGLFMYACACSQFKLGCSHSGCVIQLCHRKICLQHFRSINSGSSQREGSYFPSVSPFFLSSHHRGGASRSFCLPATCRSPGVQAVHFPQWVTGFVFANQYCWMKCYVNIFPAPC